jgi:hypothetical protein
VRSVHSKRVGVSHSRATGAALIWLTALLGGTPSRAQDANEVPDLSWGYVRVDLAGSGSFGGLTSEFEPAQLVDGFTPPPPRRQLPAVEDIPRENGALVVTNGNCDGPPGIEPNSAGFWYVQTPDEVLIVGENSPPNARTAALRRIYLDGRPHPDPARWTPNAAGHSIGWYEDGDLIAETVGMTAGGVAAGGYKTPETKLTERFHVAPDDGMLTITYTWEDPKIYARPHSYSIYFERVPADVYALEGWCDTGDPAYSYSVAPPAQD